MYKVPSSTLFPPLPERNRTVLLGKRRDLQSRIKLARREGQTALANQFSRELDRTQADLRALSRFGGESVSMRSIFSSRS